MWPYWLMYLVPMLAAAGERKHVASPVTGLRRLSLDPAWIAIWFMLTLLIGLRYQVGGDWGNYLRDLSEVEGLSLDQLLMQSDPGYKLLAGLCLNLGWGIIGVNVICAAIFSLGLTVFCRSLPFPWLGLAAATPYLVIVVAMGYTRQGVALGFELLGLTALGRGSSLRFVMWLALAATFHKTAVMLLSIAALAAARNRLWTIVWTAVACALAYVFLLQKYSDDLYQNYIAASYESQGALIRLVMNLLPAAAFLLWRRKFEFGKPEEKLWFWMSVSSFCLFGALLVSQASTAIDRIALYVLPLQIVISSNLPVALSADGKSKSSMTFLILAYYGAVLVVWLNFAVNAEYWIPYRFYLFEAGG